MAKRHLYDVTIVGAGLVGSSTALQLSRMGYKVAVLDTNRKAGAGTTSYSSTLLRTFYTTLDQVKLSHEGMQYFKQWKSFLNCPEIENYASDTMYKYPGLLFKGSKRSDAFYNKTVPLMKQLGIEVTELDRTQLEAYLNKVGWDISSNYKCVRIDDDDFGVDTGELWTGAALIPETYYVSDPMLVVENLKQASEHSGAKYHLGERVTRILHKYNTAGNITGVTGVQTDTGTTFESKVVLNAAGPWSSTINKLAFNGGPNDMKFHATPFRVEVAYVPAPEGVDFMENGFIGMDMDLGVYVRPEHGNRLLLGSLEPDCDPMEFVEPTDFENGNYPENVGESWEATVYRHALRVPNLPIPSGKQVQGIASFYDVTPDWSPVYDKSCLDGYYLALGTSGNQFKNAGVVGKLVAGIIDQCEGKGVDQDKSPFQMEMDLTRPGEYVNTGAFSRLRDIAGDTPNNVLG